MIIDFKLSIFRFNAKSDYLPYYKRYDISIDDSKNIFDMLSLIKEQDPLFDFPDSKHFALIINNHALTMEQTLKDMEEKFGRELTISPLSKRRATKDLIIDTQDFKDIFEQLNKIIDLPNEKKQYNKYIRYFYASSSLKYDKLHQGTSLFLFANELIKRYPNKKEEILTFIGDDKHGIWYHSSLHFRVFPENKELENTINSLKKQILQSEPSINLYVEKLQAKMRNL